MSKLKLKNIQLSDFEKELSNPITSDTSGDIYKVTNKKKQVKIILQNFISIIKAQKKK